MFTLAVVFLSILMSTTVSINAQACDANTPCPASAPCCSEYGYCGSGPEFCLAGCNPLHSNSVDSCKPSPVCKTQKYTFQDASRILTDRSQFDGSPDTYDWVLDGGNVTVADDNLVMILTETNAGTRVSSTRFVHYGTITATLKTGRWDGVVVGFITMSNVRDEIDWEFPGNRVTEGQTNFFWEGTNSHGDTSTGLTDTYENYHDYTIDWSPDALVFKIDGKVVRTLKAADYGNKYPTTPSRIQLSLWPAGTSASAPGTVQWAGGMIQWDDKDYVAAGNQFRTYFKSIDVTCGDPQAPSGDQISYVYAQGSTSDKQTINLSSDSPVMGGSTGTNSTSSNSTTTAPVTSTPTATDSSSVTGSSSSVTSTSLVSSTSGPSSPQQNGHGHGKNGQNGRNHGNGFGRHSGIFQAGQTDAPTPSGTPDGHNSTNGGFFGGAAAAAASITDTSSSTSATPTDPSSGSNSASGSSSSTSSSTTATDSSSTTQPTTTPGSGNKSGAQSNNVGMLPVLSAAVVMVLALAF